MVSNQERAKIRRIVAHINERIKAGIDNLSHSATGRYHWIEEEIRGYEKIRATVYAEFPTIKPSKEEPSLDRYIGQHEQRTQEELSRSQDRFSESLPDCFKLKP